MEKLLKFWNKFSHRNSIDRKQVPRQAERRNSFYSLQRARLWVTRPGHLSLTPPHTHSHYNERTLRKQETIHEWKLKQEEARK